MKNIKQTALAATISFALIGCGSDSSSPEQPQMGEFNLAVSDAPVDNVSSVVVVYHKAVLIPKGNSNPIEIDIEVSEVEHRNHNALEVNGRVDLLKVQGSQVAPLVRGLEVPAGEYQELCLYTKNGQSQDSTLSHVVSNDGSQTINPLEVHSESGCTNGYGKEKDEGVLRLGKFTVNQGQNGFVVEFDLRKGLEEPKSNSEAYTIRHKAISLHNTVEAGHIKGSVSFETVQTCNAAVDETVNAVYLYDAEVEKDEMLGFYPLPDENKEEPFGYPITAANANLQEDGNLEYNIGFIAEGAYQVAYTCKADLDAEESQEEFSVYQVKSVQVEAGEDNTLVVDFDVQE
ncbi:DUF4382 domain-containing protein [Vibrio astriarenae]|uniref:DUF4382 domain-containing protein n=1 Tax=Vibrio astriarenae TaxID=1481923 RepID=UPI003735C626